jgi:hypothetical protein
LAHTYQTRAFASIVKPDAPQPAQRDFLRKDYSYLFERFFHFVNNQPSHERGVVVFDQTEKSQSHILVGQMSEYFLRTVKGRERAVRILPEPFFVHSDLTTGIMLADLVAYILSFNVRLPSMTNPKRPELDFLGEKVKRLRPQSVEHGGYWVSAFKYIDDLRTLQQRACPGRWKHKGKAMPAAAVKASTKSVSSGRRKSNTRPASANSPDGPRGWSQSPAQPAHLT